MKIKVLKDLPKFKAGTVVNVKDKDGIPLDVFWRRRLADAKQDECCEPVEEKSATEPEPKAEAKPKVKKKAKKISE